MFFFFKQKTAYEMRISDWSSDVCSSDLVGLLAANLAGLQRPVLAGNIAADRRKDTLHAAARVGGAAHDLDLARAGIDDANPETIRVGVLPRLLHIGDGEGLQRLRAIRHALDLEADHRQLVGDFLEGGGGVEMVLQPAERELHGATSP